MSTSFRGLLSACTILAAACLLVLSRHWDLAGLVALRAIALPVSLATGGVLLLLAWRLKPFGWPLVMVLSGTSMVFSGHWQLEAHRQQQRAFELPPAIAHEIGQHLIVGFTQESEITELISRGLIGGVFITRRNIEGKQANDIRQLIANWQSLRQRSGLAPLIIATDQEGGLVSRMSPPLPLQKPLGQLLRDSNHPAQTAQEYGREQGQGLAQLGITLNFAPVVDLDHGIHNPDDKYSKISRRALGRDPVQVANAARAYCAGLAEHQVQCTLKHFPGLGRVFEDTHADSASIHTPPAELSASDLQPFRTLHNHHSFIMLSHAKLASLDASRPASSSPKVIEQLIRQDWQYQGLLITDDLGMAGAREQDGGSEAGAILALNAGVDYLLIAWDPILVYPILNALVEAKIGGVLNSSQLDRSRQRMTRQSIIRSAP
ncbi:glycoside hydrolase family 3 N-terminal domain-containing protein [Chitinibacter tainanensis]|uniref:glycoside hydrolase family 3 N-terminal domain-containing protein n=1 Tax=Chitinibacter tainanensis TaxID=230667 RepID=UPI00041D519D|nr:glycoside hydrolase family 3 N-terminal domain-containing protein [Chitinibacter tainanensis]